MTLQRIKLSKLFGVFDHEITIKDGGITLVLGENGVGKTVILKMLKIVFDGNYMQLKHYDFERFDLFFNDFKYSFFGSTGEEERLLVRKYEKSKKIDEFDFLNPAVVDYFSSQQRLFKDENTLFENDFIHHHRLNPELEYALDKYLGRYVSRIGRNEWLEHRTGKYLPTRLVLSKYGDHMPLRFRNILINSTPNWLEEFSNRCKIYLIETQRLKTTKSSENYQDAIIDLSKELSQTVKSLLASANEFAAQLDRTYPTRLLSRISSPEKISNKELISKLDLLETRRERLAEVGLVDVSKDDIDITLSPKQDEYQQELIKNVLLVYIDDSNKKMSFYDELVGKLSTFINILNKRLNVKYVQIDKDKGLRILPEKDRDSVNQKEIPLLGLSSGEQHMIILFYNLLFKCEKNSLILIDEPEISLHITWQNEFINDLALIKTINPFDAIIATHSPDIINDNWNLTVELLDKQ